MKKLFLLALIVIATLLPSVATPAQAADEWAGTYAIYSEGYRGCPIPFSIRLDLTRTAKNTYKGVWTMGMADDDENYSGIFIGQVTATASGDYLTIRLKSHRTIAGSSDNYFTKNSEYYPALRDGTAIAKIHCIGFTREIIPLGNMKKYLSDILQLTILKVRKPAR